MSSVGLVWFRALVAVSSGFVTGACACLANLMDPLLYNQSSGGERATSGLLVHVPQTRTQTCTNQHNKHRFIALSESSKRMHKAAAAADVRVGQGSFWRIRRRPL